MCAFRVLLAEAYTCLSSHVTSTLKKMVKNVQVTGDSVDEDDLDEAVGLRLSGNTWIVRLSLFEGCQGSRTTRKGIRRGSKEGGTPLDLMKTCNAR